MITQPEEQGVAHSFYFSEDEAQVKACFRNNLENLCCLYLSVCYFTKMCIVAGFLNWVNADVNSVSMQPILLPFTLSVKSRG